jgi:glycerophosphoryl diester phosphodiesterase
MRYLLTISYDGKNFPRELSLLNQRVGSIESTTKSLGKPSTLDYEDFEIGNITIDKTGWAYSARNSRVRMKAGVTYHLFVGDIIALPDGVRAYLGYRVNGEYKALSWFTGEWIATEEGDYKILLSGVTENTLSSKYDLLTDVRIKGGECRYENKLPLDADSLSTLRVINHRGFNSEAPENTLPAFALSKLKGFRYVETDVHFTSDGVPVCIHDYTVERTSNGGNRRVDSMTLEELKALDFGSWFSADYTGTQIPTFEEFLILCKKLGLKPYAEIKGGNAEALRGLCDIVRLYGMEKHITYISSSMDSLNWLLDYNPKVRIGLLGNAYSEIYLSNLIALRDRGADVFADMQGTGVTDEVFITLRNNGFEVEVWTTSLASTLAHKADGVTTDAALYWEYSGNRPVWYSNDKGWKE